MNPANLKKGDRVFLATSYDSTVSVAIIAEKPRHHLVKTNIGTYRTADLYERESEAWEVIIKRMEQKLNDAERQAQWAARNLDEAHMMFDAAVKRESK